MYQLYKNSYGEIKSVIKTEENQQPIGIPFDPANIDYQTFKKEINEGAAQLEDADGNVMTQEQANEFVTTLP